MRRARGLDVNAVGRWIWRAVILVAALNVLLIVALLVSRGEIPGVWSPAPAIGPGATVRIAGVGLVAREEPDMTSPIVADLPEGGTVRISGEPAQGQRWPLVAGGDRDRGRDRPRLRPPVVGAGAVGAETARPWRCAHPCPLRLR